MGNLYYEKHDWADSIMVGTTLASIIAVFFGTKKAEKKKNKKIIPAYLIKNTFTFKNNFNYRIFFR